MYKPTEVEGDDWRAIMRARVELALDRDNLEEALAAIQWGRREQEREAFRAQCRRRWTSKVTEEAAHE